MADVTGAEVLRGLYDYHRWANRKLYDIAAALGDEPVTRDLGRHFSESTLKGMLAHLYGADRVWLDRWKGNSAARLKGDKDFATLADVRAQWDALEAEQRAFVDGLTPADLDRVVDYANTEGKRFQVRLWPLLQHVANHATHHRSELATMITLVSGSPPDTGISTYMVSGPGAKR